MKNNWEIIINSYFEKYSGLEIDDIYKFIYQGIFGPEGKFDDKSKARFMLDYAKAQKNENIKMMEKISPDKDLYRINMGVYKYKDGDQAALFEWYYRSFSFDYGDREEFEEAWNAFISVNDKNNFFHGELMDDFTYRLKRFAIQNHDALPVIEHSRLFVLMNKPAYRVINFRAMIGALKDSILSK